MEITGELARRRLPLLLAAALAPLAGAAPAEAAKKVPQGNYRGAAGGATFAMNIVDGDWVYGMRFDMSLRCPSGARPKVIYVTDFSGFEGTGPKVTRKGVIRFDKTSDPATENDAKRIRISGRISATRRRGKGKISLSYLAGRFSGCTTGSVRWRVKFKRRLSFDQIVGRTGL